MLALDARRLCPARRGGRLGFLQAAAGLWLAGTNCFQLARAAQEQTPVILISIDTLRADHLSAYGYRRIQTPNIDSFARQGTLFTDAACQIPLTLPSHTSLFTSTYPFENRIEENAERVPPGAVTLAAVLRSHGYKTAAFVGSIFLERQMGLDQGFDAYDSPFSFLAGSRISGSLILAGPARNPYSVRETRDGALVVRAALRWLDANRGQPIFVFLHLFDMHEPYSVPQDVARRRGISRYDAQLEYTDRVLGRFRQALVDGGWWDRSLVVLLSDHGEGLGEHGESNHGYFIYQSTLWVPLLFHWPSGAPAYPERVSQPAGLIDVAPTILNFLGIPAPTSFEGQALVGADPGEADPRAVYSESLYTHDAFGWAPLRSLRLGAYKYIEAPRAELYDLHQDPHEQNNILAKNSAEAPLLQSKLKSLLARYAPSRAAQLPGASPETHALLSSLGYLSGSPSKSDGSGPDPKDRIAELQLYERALDYLSQRRLDEAIATLGQILARDPHNILARRDLGGCYIERASYAKARANFQKVVAVVPDDYMAQLELGIADEHLGLLREAIEHVQVACRLYPESAQCHRELDTLQKKIK